VQDPRTLEGRILRALTGSGVEEASSRAARAARTLEELGARAIALEESDYPVALRDLPDPPPLLFVRGHRLPGAAKAVAIVGSRAVSLP
jgi:DNA processing protein